MALKGKRVRVVLKRRNGRIVKKSRLMGRYAAKQMRAVWDEKYDNGYYTEIEPSADDGQ